MTLASFSLFLKIHFFHLGRYSLCKEEAKWKVEKNSGFLCSVQFSRSVMSDSLRLHGQQHASHPSPSPTPGAHSNSCPLCRCCHPNISSSVIPFSSHFQSFPASGSFPKSWFFVSGGQRIGVSASASHQSFQ